MLSIRKDKTGKTKIERGDEVVDKISGFKGIVTTVTRFVAGCVRIQVVSRELHNGKPIEPETFDAPNLKILKSAAVKPAPLEKTNVDLGDKVKHNIVKNLEGIVTSRSDTIHGTVSFGVTQEKLDSDGKVPDIYSFQSKNISKVKKVIEKKKKETGGDQVIPRSYM